MIFFFFFSSRRRHTRSYGDWSSDVCSSDLKQLFQPENAFHIEMIGGLIQKKDVGFGSQSLSDSKAFLPASGKSAGGSFRSEERRVGKECRSRGSPYY